MRPRASAAVSTTSSGQSPEWSAGGGDARLFVLNADHALLRIPIARRRQGPRVERRGTHRPRQMHSGTTASPARPASGRSSRTGRAGQRRGTTRCPRTPRLGQTACPRRRRLRRPRRNAPIRSSGTWYSHTRTNTPAFDHSFRRVRTQPRSPRRASGNLYRSRACRTIPLARSRPRRSRWSGPSRTPPPVVELMPVGGQKRSLVAGPSGFLPSELSN